MAEAAQQQTQTVEDLGKLVKGKYPDAYGALSDADVGRKVKAKYPQYSQFQDIASHGPGVGGMKPLKPGEVVPEREAEKKAANRAGYEGMAETALSAASAYGAAGAVAKAPSVIAGLRAGGLPAIKKYAANALLEAGAAFGTYEGVSRGLESVGVNSTLANIAGALAGLGMGGKIEEYLGKDTFEKLAAKEWEARYGSPPKTPGEKLRARGLAQAEVAKGRNVDKPAKPLSAKAQAEAVEAQKAAKIKESADAIRAERGPLPERKPLEAKAADIPEGPDVKHTAPEPGRRPAPPARKPTLKERTAGRVPLYAQEGVQAADIPEGTAVAHTAPAERVQRTPERKPTLKEKLAGRVPLYAREGMPKADIPEVTRESTAAPDTRTTKEKIEAGRRKRTEVKPEGNGSGSGAGGNGSSYGFTHPKESLTDVRKQLFSNTQQQQIPNDQVRVRFTQLHGHGISAGTYDEIQQFNEYIAKNGKLPLPPPKETEK